MLVSKADQSDTRICVYINMTNALKMQRIYFFFNCNKEFNFIIMNYSEIKGENTCIRHIPQQTFTMVYISFLFIPRILHSADFSWMKYGTEQILFLQNYGINLLKFLPYC